MAMPEKTILILQRCYEKHTNIKTLKDIISLYSACQYTCVGKFTLAFGAHNELKQDCTTNRGYALRFF